MAVDFISVAIAFLNVLFIKAVSIIFQFSPATNSTACQLLKYSFYFNGADTVSAS